MRASRSASSGTAAAAAGACSCGAVAAARLGARLEVRLVWRLVWRLSTACDAFSCWLIDDTRASSSWSRRHASGGGLAGALRNGGCTSATVDASGEPTPRPLAATSPAHATKLLPLCSHGASNLSTCLCALLHKQHWLTCTHHQLKPHCRPHPGKQTRTGVAK